MQLAKSYEREDEARAFLGGDQKFKSCQIMQNGVVAGSSKAL